MKTRLGIIFFIISLIMFGIESSVSEAKSNLKKSNKLALEMNSKKKGYDEIVNIYNKKDLNEVVENLDEIYSSDKKVLELVNNYGYFVSLTEKYIKSIPYFLEVLKVNPDRIVTYINLGDVYNKKYKAFNQNIDNEVAKLYYKKYLELAEKQDKIKYVPDYVREIVTENNQKNLLEKVLLNDDFTSNKNNWSLREDDQVNLKIKGGYYIIYPKYSHWSCWKTIGIDENYDFIIESEVKKISGRDNNTFGIIFGRDSKSKDEYVFGITGDGSYKFQKYEDGKWMPIIDYTKSDYINKFNSTNKIKIEKKSDELLFFINNKLVDKTKYRKFYGNRLGFAVSNGIEVGFENIKVTKIYR